MAKIAINGLGRIGRAALKIILDTPELELTAINDLVPPDNLAYLLSFDTVYGKSNHKIEAGDSDLTIDGKKYPVYNKKDPSELPWEELGIDIVLECSGVFTKIDVLSRHLQAGARFVILSAPSKSPEVLTIVPGVNKVKDKDIRVISCASCTTNSIAPIMEIMTRRIGVKKGILNTVHAYTSSQGIVDKPSKKFRRGRAAAVNIVPTSTGAAEAAAKAVPELKDKFNGISLRVPVPAGSISDITFITEKKTTAEEINKIFKEEAGTDRYKKIICVNEDEIVSSDIIGNSHASIIDLTMTRVVDGDLVKVMAWYDNEWGYTSQMIREAKSIAVNL